MCAGDSDTGNGSAAGAASESGMFEGMGGGIEAGMEGSMAPGSLGAGAAGSVSGKGGGLSGSEAANIAGQDGSRGGWGDWGRKAKIGATIGMGMAGVPGAIVGGIAGALTAAPGAGGTPTGIGDASLEQNDIRGKSISDQAKVSKATLLSGQAVKKKKMPVKEKPKVLVAKPTKRPTRTIATSPLGVITPPTIRRKTLLGQ